MPMLAFANSFWENYDLLEKPVKSGAFENGLVRQRDRP
jgi:hypothetical protein